MSKRAHLTIFMGAGGVALAAASASGQALITFGYNDLSAGYQGTSSTTGTLALVARADVNFRTSGDVSRIGPASGGGGDAVFQPGFTGTSVNADVFISLSRNGTAGTGTYHITADNNDDLSGNLTGTFALVGTATVFTGTATGVFSDPGQSFTGSPATTFFTQVAGTLNGAFTLSLDSGDFFGHNYTFTPSQAQGMFPAPAPGTLALLGFAGFAAGRRRRR
jgi:hypothetical protein